MIILGTNSIKETGYDVANSVRFNDGDSPRMHKTPSGAGNRRKFTISAWVKRGSNLGANSYIFDARVDGSDNAPFQFNTSDQIFFRTKVGGSSYYIQTNRVFRDVSAFYHLAIVYDNTLGTAGDRIQLWVNGVRETSFADSAMPPQNTDTTVNNASVVQTVGSEGGGASFFDGYISEFVLLDGTADSPVDTLGSFDEDSGIWKPKNVSGLTAGTNGFYLDFEDSSNLGNDAFGGTDLTEVNLAAIDQMVDTPTNNYATFNPLIVGEPTATFLGYAEGNLQGSSAGGVSANTILLPTSGKWFVEYHFNNASASSDPGVGFWSIDTSQAHRWYQSSFKGLAWKYNDDVYLNGSNSFTAATFSSGDIISIAVDMDNNRVTFYKNGSAVNNLTNYSFDFTVSLGNFTVGIVDGRTASAGDANFDMNAGQNGTFNGRKTAGGNSDGDGYGNFSMSVPSGYYALNTKNLAEYG